MFDPKRYIFAGGTVVVALAIGMVMQQPSGMLASNKRAVGPGEAEIAALDLSDVAFTSAVSDLPKVSFDTVAPSEDTPAPPELAALTPDATPGTLPVDQPCAVTLSASALPAARLAISVGAPCHAGQIATVHHNGMMINLLTDTRGAATAVLPALSPVAVIIASFEDGAGTVVTAEVADTAAYDRVVLQWRGAAGFEMHALENGADYGAAGHVWSGVPHAADRALSGIGGYLETLGDLSLADGLRAQVYTFPRDVDAPAAVVLNAEIEVTEANCDKPVEAQAIQMSGGSALRVQELSLTLPSCAVAGDILLLKNLLEDLKIADN